MIPTALLPDDPVDNRLLAALPPADYARLLPHLERVSVPLTHVFYEPGRPIPSIYFPTRVIASLVIHMVGGGEVEVAAVGAEGMVGLPIFLGTDTIPFSCYAQIPGEALRMPAEVLIRETSVGAPLHDVLHRYTQALMVQVAQSMACAQCHSLEERCCRWLLMTQDRVRTDTFLLTQEFLGHMLGVRRPRASMVASTLQKAGLIRYSRGRITILDRAGLEAGSCECYGIITGEFNRLI